MGIGRINAGRVLLGGLLAGVILNASETVLNLYVVAKPMEEILKARNLPPIPNSAIGVFVILCFLLGIVTVWLYAAIRPRFGPGARAAVMAALAVFFLAYVYPTMGMGAMGFYPSIGPIYTSLIWGLAEIVVAAIAGAWVYQE